MGVRQRHNHRLWRASVGCRTLVPRARHGEILLCRRLQHAGPLAREDHSATFVSFNPANIGAPLTCSSNVPGNYQRLRIEKEDTKSGPVIHTGDIVRLRFDDSPSAFVEVRGTNVYAGGKPSLFQIIANVAEKAVKIPHSVKTDATPPVSTVPSRPGDISDECKQQ